MFLVVSVNTESIIEKELAIELRGVELCLD